MRAFTNTRGVFIFPQIFRMLPREFYNSARMVDFEAHTTPDTFARYSALLSQPREERVAIDLYT